SPPAGVQSAHQVCPSMPLLSMRTDPSARPTFMPPRWELEARLGSHSISQGSGCDSNLEPGPRLQTAKTAALGSNCWYAQALILSSHEAYRSEKRRVLEVPSGKLAGMRA